MNADMFQRLLALSKKTGDRLVVVEGDSATVLLPIERYEELMTRRSERIPVEKLPVTPSAPQKQPVIKTEPIEDPIEAMNREVAALREKAAQVTNLAAFMDEVQKDEEIREEQFYLEPVE